MSNIAREMFGVRGDGRRARSSSDSAPSAARRPEGVSREVFMLTGGCTPASLVPSPALGLQSKPKAKRSWARTPFYRSPEDKGLILTHWAPVGQPHDSYAFARFNRPVKILRYTDAEYNAVIANLQPLNVDEAALAALKKRTPARAKTAAQKAVKAIKAAAASVAMKEKGTLKDKSALQVAIPSVGALNMPTATAVSSPPTSLPIVPGILSPKAPSAAPASSVAAGTRKTILASPKALAAAAAAAAAVPPAVSPKPPKPPATDAQEAVAGVLTGTPTSPGSLRQALHYVKPQKPWTRAETDELFDLCARFDLRFAVIHDRWPDSLEARSVEELKDRYYSVAKRLIEYRTRTNKDALTSLPLALQKHCQAITMNPYDYEYECIRKNQLEWQYRRSKAELREEEETVREARRIEANRKRLAKERQRLAKLLTPAGDIAMSADTKRGSSLDHALAAAAAATMPQKTFPHRKVQSGAYARSSMIYTPISASQRVAKRIDSALKDLGVGTRPTPTSIVVDNFDLLRMDILAFIELQRTVMRKEEDVYSLRVKLAKLKGEEIPPAPPGVTLSHKKRKIDDVEFTSLFSGPVQKKKNPDS